MSRPRLITLLLAFATLIIYLPVASHDFLYYDDPRYITQNVEVQQGLTWNGIKWAFTTFDAGNWHPLTWISHMADCELFGLNSGAQHLINALFHAANTALLFAVLWRMTGQPRPAALVAALFAWHPLHVETVAWAAERKDVLSTCLALLALWHYANFARDKRRSGWWLALLFFTLSLMAKPMFVTFPFLLLLLDFWPLGRFRISTRVRDATAWQDFEFRILKPLVIEKIPFFALTAASCVVTFFAQRAGDSVATLEEWPMSNRLENALASVGRYLLKTFWPDNLALDYPWAPVPVATLMLSATVLLAVSGIAWHLRRRSPYAIMGWLWFLGTLVPVIGLVQVGHASMADRYTYFPSIGLFLMVAFGVHEWCGSAPGRMKIRAVAEYAVLAACIFLTERQISYWRNTETLFRHTIAVTKNNGAAHLSLASAYRQEGRFADALVEYRETLRLSPHFPMLHLTIGEMLDKLGQPGDALAEYQIELRKNSQSSALHSAMGTALAEQGNAAAATGEFQEAIQLDSHNADPHLGLAKMDFAKGQETDAAYELLAAFHAEPNNPHVLATVSRYLAANADSTARDPNTALLLARRADGLSPGQPEVLDAMGMAFAATGDFSNAVSCAQRALDAAAAAGLKDTNGMQLRLELYQKSQPWLESFRGTNGPPLKE